MEVVECNDCGCLWRGWRENIHKLLAERSLMGILDSLSNVCFVFLQLMNALLGPKLLASLNKFTM